MIRSWLASDNPAVAKIERESFSDPWSQSMLDQSFLSPAFKGFVEDDGGIKGYVGIICYGDAEIALIAVDPSFRKRGIGKKLLGHAVAFAKENGAENVFLEVRKSNEPAKALYSGFGFNAIAVRPKYYADGEDAIVMVLDVHAKEEK